MHVFTVPFSLFPLGDGPSHGLVALMWFMSIVAICKLLLTILFISRALSSLQSTFIRVSSATLPSKPGTWAHLIDGGSINIRESNDSHDV